jgi:hypothetical protein
MSKTLRRAAAAVISVGVGLALGGNAQAATTVFNSGPPNQVSGFELTNFVAAAGFKLNTAATVTDVHFWDLESQRSPQFSGSITWWITGDSGGTPDFNNILSTGNTTAVARAATGLSDVGGLQLQEFSNDFTIPAVMLAAGTEYHLALHNGPTTNTNPNPFGPQFYWESADNIDTPQFCSLTSAIPACFNNWANNTLIPGNAFFLSGVSAVPEPSTWVMMLLGFAGLGFAFRQSRRKVPFA